MFRVFGQLDADTTADLTDIVSATDGMLVPRRQRARSSTPFPSSNDLEAELVAQLGARGFEHHTRMQHPTSGVGFEYDFWRGRDQVAMEIRLYAVSLEHAGLRGAGEVCSYAAAREV